MVTWDNPPFMYINTKTLLNLEMIILFLLLFLTFNKLIKISHWSWYCKVYKQMETCSKILY